MEILFSLLLFPRFFRRHEVIGMSKRDSRAQFICSQEPRTLVGKSMMSEANLKIKKTVTNCIFFVCFFVC